MLETLCKKRSCFLSSEDEKRLDLVNFGMPHSCWLISFSLQLHLMLKCDYLGWVVLRLGNSTYGIWHMEDANHENPNWIPRD